jgi:hypothetical protein
MLREQCVWGHVWGSKIDGIGKPKAVEVYELVFSPLHKNLYVFVHDSGREDTQNKKRS